MLRYNPHLSEVIETAVSSTNARPKPVVLLILDGWGHREDPADNALALAELPNWRQLLATCRIR